MRKEEPVKKDGSRKVVFVTTNKGKAHSAKSTLSQLGIEVVHISLELPEPRSDDLKEIAKEKAHFAFETLKQPVMVHDAGFYIDSLNGFPKAFVNFALDTIGIEGILKLVEGKPRTCLFRNCLAFLDATLATPVYFESEIRGGLADASRGSLPDYAWSSLWLVFIPQGYTQTLGEMNEEEFQKWREKRLKDTYLTKFAEWFLRR